MPTEPEKPIVPTANMDSKFQQKIVRHNVIAFVVLHILLIYSLFHLVWYRCWLTFIWATFLVLLSGQGVTLGAHRLYSHRAFKVHYSIRLLVIICHVIAGQNSMYTWVRDHRQHHMYSGTDADPHNAERGFFFSHMGWLLVKKHPAVIAKGKNVDMSDIKADPIAIFQKKYFVPLYVIFSVLIPVAVPMYFWNETFVASFCIAYAGRYVVTLHITWLVNSVAHMYGTRPYDKNIAPVESLLVSVLSNGEGWHNYHHTFPWDYRASELGMKANVTTFLIDILAYLGLAYDLRTTPERMVKQRVLRTGDGTKTYAEEK